VVIIKCFTLNCSSLCVGSRTHFVVAIIFLLKVVFIYDKFTADKLYPH
jgi:hypothetical protein